MAPAQIGLPPIGGNCTHPLRVDDVAAFTSMMLSSAGCDPRADPFTCHAVVCVPETRKDVSSAVCDALTS